MSDTVKSPLERFPEGAIEVAQGYIQDFNQAAQQQFPDLAVGMVPPAFLSSSLSDPEGAGTFAYNGATYLFSRVSGEERDLLLFRPAPQSSLTDRQLDGFVRQMRGFLQDILLEFETVSGPQRDGMDSFSKSFCRVYRLLTNLDFMRAMGSKEGVPFHPVTMDLAGLCRRIVQEASFLLEESGINLSYRIDTSLLIPGDPALLQKLILSLLSNAAKAAPGGEVALSLTRRGSRAVLTISDDGRALEQNGLEALFPNAQADGHIPVPQEGAGMGLAIARHIVSLHKGTMLLEQRSGGGLFAVVSLPIGTLSTSLTVRSPQAEEDMGISPVLVELSDVLPLSLFQLENEE